MEIKEEKEKVRSVRPVHRRVVHHRSRAKIHTQSVTIPVAAPSSVTNTSVNLVSPPSVMTSSHLLVPFICSCGRSRKRKKSFRPPETSCRRSRVRRRVKRAPPRERVSPKASMVQFPVRELEDPRPVHRKPMALPRTSLQEWSAKPQARMRMAVTRRAMQLEPRLVRELRARVWKSLPWPGARSRLRVSVKVLSMTTPRIESQQLVSRPLGRGGGSGSTQSHVFSEWRDIPS